jgi:hypothetical protein
MSADILSAFRTDGFQPAAKMRPMINAAKMVALICVPFWNAMIRNRTRRNKSRPRETVGNRLALPGCRRNTMEARTEATTLKMNVEGELDQMVEFYRRRRRQLVLLLYVRELLEKVKPARLVRQSRA